MREDCVIRHDSRTLIQDVVQLLHDFEVDFNTFGAGTADPLDQLVDEVRTQKCTLGAENGRLVRRARTVCITVQSPDSMLYLCARKQVIAATGAEIDLRPGIFPAKKTPRDVPDLEALRAAMLAELRLDDSCYTILSGPEDVEKQNYYPSFPQPEINSIYLQQFWEVRLFPKAFVPEGYIDVSTAQGNITKFVWVSKRPTRP